MLFEKLAHQTRPFLRRQTAPGVYDHTPRPDQRGRVLEHRALHRRHPAKVVRRQAPSYLRMLPQRADTRTRRVKQDESGRFSAQRRRHGDVGAREIDIAMAQAPSEIARSL